MDLNIQNITLEEIKYSYTHVEVGRELCHIGKFAERMEKNGATHEPAENNQPKDRNHVR